MESPNDLRLGKRAGPVASISGGSGARPAFHHGMKLLLNAMSTASTAGHGHALLTDLYQLTMANGYWRAGVGDREAVFHLYFRNHPFQGGYTVSCGQGPVLDYLRGLAFSDDDLAYLGTLTGADGAALFAPDFLEYLGGLELALDVDAMPEGTVAFPNEPILRVRGPLLQCQLVETALLNTINFQSLIATKAARICYVAGAEPVLEFGLRRAQGIDGALAASRAAYVGGCAGTSNVLAGKLFGIPVKGTHAHSWVMSFESEQEAFEAYAETMPNNCVFLVDTYDTLQGVQRALAVGQQLRERGHELLGIRLDSGDLAWLSIEARRLLDEAGFEQTQIIASNDLDEHLIRSLHEQGAKIGVWGVGTKLVTAFDQPALGGVYKLAALRDGHGRYRHTLKVSEQARKTSNPGVLQVLRFVDNGVYVGDALVDELQPPVLGQPLTIVDPNDPQRQKTFESGVQRRELLVPRLRAGQEVGPREALAESRARVQEELAAFHSGVKRFEHPHDYPVGLEESLHRHKMQLVRDARGLG